MEQKGQKEIRSIAIHLPQFYPIPENDLWWGKGFTEWTNVTKARPLYKGHYQPHLPADLGFYDLRLPEARQAQADLARAYGIYGFCYYHYWFNGRRILERPVDEILALAKPDYPFMLCWANENWTRVWDGGEKNILLEQKYAAQDDLEHIRSLIPFFNDPRYIRIDNKPVFAVYKSALFPDMSGTIRIWREEAAKHNIQLYLCRFESVGSAGKEYLTAGFDAAIEFQPLINYKQTKIKTLKDEISLQTVQQSIKFRTRKLKDKLLKPRLPENIASYRHHIEQSISRYNGMENYKLYRGVCPGWDNSSRRESGYYILDGSTPELFENWVEQSLASFVPYSKDENLFFINAWNEWAEGNHMEPCRKWGRAYLEAFKRASQKYR